MICYIPARIGSKRIKEKNIKKLNNLPVIGHVIREVKKLKFIKKIYVSTDSKKIKKIVEKIGAETLDLRKKKLATSKASFYDLIQKDLPRYLKKNLHQDIMFVLPTSALINKKIYNDAFCKYKFFKPEVLMSVTEINPFFAMIKKNNYIKPIFKKLVLKRTQDLPKAFIDVGSFYFFNYNKIKKYNSLKNAKKYYHMLLIF